MRPMIRTWVCNGIGDRVLDVIGIGVLARFLGRGAHVQWETDPQNFPYGNGVYDQRLFDFSEVIQSVSDGVGEQDAHTILNYNACVTLSPFMVFRCLKTILEHPNHLDRPMEPTEQLEFMEEVALAFRDLASKVKPGACLAPHLRDLRELHDLQEYVGIHMRRTDKVNDNGNMAHETSRAEYDRGLLHLLEHVQDLIRSGQEKKFYVVSDDREFKHRFADRIRRMGVEEEQDGVEVLVTSPADLDEAMSQYTGAYDVFEYFNLMACKRILQGIKYSTFSLSAALIAQKELVNFHSGDPGNSGDSGENRRWLLHLWKPCVDVRILNTRYRFATDLEAMQQAAEPWRPLHF